MNRISSSDGDGLSVTLHALSVVPARTHTFVRMSLSFYRIIQKGPICGMQLEGPDKMPWEKCNRNKIQENKFRGNDAARPLG